MGFHGKWSPYVGLVLGVTGKVVSTVSDGVKQIIHP